MKIMVCYDGSEVAQMCLDLAKKHAEAFQGGIYLVRSLEGGSDLTPHEIMRIEGELNAQARQVSKAAGIHCESHMLMRGITPGEDLVLFARENQIDEIIIGIQKRSKVGKLLFGSTAQYVILEAACPVVTLGLPR